MRKGLLTATAVLVATIFPATTSAAELPEIKLSIQSIDTPTAQVQGSNGERGAAIARLADGRLLLGGGSTGFTLFLYDLTNQQQITIGRAAAASERINDSRFAITDISVLTQTAETAQLLISYPRFNSEGRCVTVVVYSYRANFGAQPSLKRGKMWFQSKPCVAISAVQHAAGRMELIDAKSAYLTIGDLGYPEIGDKTKRGTLGTVMKISAKKVTQISSGHRNAQGILLIGKDLYTSEHGPRGGDELNLIQQGIDYGWPTVTYGERYSPGDYVSPTNPESHNGFRKPLTYWVPSVAPTELIQLPAASAWGQWSSSIVMGTLREESLIFIQMNNKRVVGQMQTVNVYERIRDLDVTKDGSIIATTDSGKLLVINPLS
ncbi:MAG: glucose dehydrogenase [Actinobacteria bacterium BACL15 MAG-120619-bin91]|jgi:aldose sugar dehydrogenase|uniref:Glucose dehydrogenase n=2 Tax=Actinomycetes TaxID=1760 RepID=A0A0R2PAZ9_9ACTN|nr:MAG: glucose dehydrogenase [Actinobacteria bacterium BACL15 MAG-120619-bin91]